MNGESTDTAHHSSLANVVLVIDDESSVREAIKDILELYDINVLLAANGKESIELLQQNVEQIKLVLLDLSMPDMDGRETLQHLRKISQRVPILITSGHQEKTLRAQFAGQNVTDFVEKPFTFNTLIEKVNQYLG